VILTTMFIRTPPALSSGGHVYPVHQAAPYQQASRRRCLPVTVLSDQRSTV